MFGEWPEGLPQSVTLRLTPRLVRSLALFFSGCGQVYPFGRSMSAGGKVLHVVLFDPGDGADRDSRFVAAPQVPFPGKHAGHVVVTRVDDGPFDLPGAAVGGTGALAAAHGHLAHGDGVVGDGLPDSGDQVAPRPGPPPRLEYGQESTCSGAQAA